MTELCPFNVHAPKWHLAYFVPIDVNFGLFFTFVLPIIYISFDIQTNFEVNRPFFGFKAKKFLEALIKNRPELVSAKSIFTSILKVSDKLIKNVGGIGFLVNDTWAKWGFEMWQF